MNYLTPTQLRNRLFKELRVALQGIPVHIQTRFGNAVIVSEEVYSKTKNPHLLKKRKD
ncbi:MAG: hypothetical protein GKR87_00530 [Kiritimatiellae bacterium]|nr:hypothetical protein [Kiritimatiellia bacterium]